MFSFFKKRSNRLSDYSFLKTDMHSHLIPGIDDGAKSVAESIILIKQLKALGYEKIITTPHIYQSYYPNTPAIINAQFEQLKSALANQGIDIEIEVAAEYFLDAHVLDLLNREEPLLTFSGKHILVELSTLGEIQNWKNGIFNLIAKGYQPILAHPARYLYLSNPLNVFSTLREQGCELQINLFSLAGKYGKGQQQLAYQLLKGNMADYLGTDLHRESQLAILHKLLSDKIFQKAIGQKVFKNNTL